MVDRIFFQEKNYKIPILFKILEDFGVGYFQNLQSRVESRVEFQTLK